MGDPRWSAVVSDEVAALVISYRHHEEVLRRYFEKIDYGFSPEDCWVWTGALSSTGYGNFALPRQGAVKRVIRAHRVGWLWQHGVLTAEAPFLDHINCVGRFCVRPSHLEPVDEAENQRRRRDVGESQQRFLRQAELALRDERRARGEEEVF